jgi:hypothetical protein
LRLIALARLQLDQAFGFQMPQRPMLGWSVDFGFEHQLVRDSHPLGTRNPHAIVDQKQQAKRLARKPRSSDHMIQGDGTLHKSSHYPLRAQAEVNLVLAGN